MSTAAQPPGPPPPQRAQQASPALTNAITALGTKLDGIAATLTEILLELQEDDAPITPQWGETKVATTGVAQILGNAAVSVVVVQALAGNAGTVTLGDQSVGRTIGYQLAASQAVGVNVANLYQLSVNGTAGDGVCWLGS